MKNKKEIFLKISLVAIILLIIATGILYFSKGRKTDTPKETDSGKITIQDENSFLETIPLYGNWNSTQTEIYVDGELKLAFVDTDEKNLQIYSENIISICYKENNELICQDSNYTYIDNKLVIEKEDTYLSKESEVTLNGDTLILKSVLTDNRYSLLYFEKN